MTIRIFSPSETISQFSGYIYDISTHNMISGRREGGVTDRDKYYTSTTLILVIKMKKLAESWLKEGNGCSGGGGCGGIWRHWNGGEVSQL